jgi:L-amino acid N-acyltransferase YncA
MDIEIVPMQPADWPLVREIYAEGIATGDATFETDVPDWEHWDKVHRNACRLVAKKDGRVIGWAARRSLKIGV